jgi:hypothetical protein
VTDLPDRILAAIEQAKKPVHFPCGSRLYDPHPTMDVWHPDGHLKPVDDATLRRCEADKRTVERHAPHILTNSARKPQPIICSYCSHVPDAVEWPCPDLLDRAAAYDVPTTPTAETA